jgi:tetratricopeptide (TPR) repeat protein
MTVQTHNPITIRVVTDFAHNLAWVHTRGMARFDRPDLEWYWSPADSHQKGSEALKSLAQHVIKDEAGIEIGDIVSLPDEQMVIQFRESTKHQGADFDGNRVLRIQRLTTGEEGAGIFRELVGGGSNSVSSHNRRGLSHHLKGEFAEAWLAYEQAFNLDPQNFYTLNNMGHLLLKQDHCEDSIQFFQRAIGIEPAYAVPHNNLGNAYLNLGRVEEATAEYQTAIAVDQAYAMPHRNLALVYHLLGRTIEAIEEYRHYFELAPAGTKDADAHYNLGVMLEEKGTRDVAIAEYEQAIADDPQHAKALNNLGLGFFSLGEVERATDFYTKSVEADENFGLAHYNLGTVLAARGEYQQAIDQFKRASEIDPENIQAASNLGVMYSTTKRFTEAIAVFEELTAREPQQATLHFNLAVAYQGKGLKGKARKEFQKVIELEPKDSRRALRAQREIEALNRGSKKQKDA